jgi:hypothetical protein
VQPEDKKKKIMAMKDGNLSRGEFDIKNQHLKIISAIYLRKRFRGVMVY